LTATAGNIRKSKKAGSTSKLGGSPKLGAVGERLAEKFLITKGYSILARNYYIRGGEIDIVATKGDIIVFVEVKTRRQNRFGEAFEAVDERKKSRLLKAAYTWLAKNGYKPWRCDLIAIDLNASGNSKATATICHYKNIFLR